jgi:hypothetical protein
MLLPEPLRRNAVFVGAAAGLLLGLAGGLAWPLPRVPGPTGGEIRLAVPPRSALERYSEADFAALRSGTLWSGSGATQAGSRKISTWRLLGVVLRPAAVALIQAGNRQLRIGVGEGLPDGGTLLAVRADSVEFQQGQCNYRRALYSPADQPLPSDGCPSAPNNDAANRPAGN